MDRLSFQVNEYEGPLDLILTLLARHQLNIRDINISSLLDQYLAAVRGMKERNLDLASEFLEMASRLVYIKSVSLLPKYGDGEDPRKELTVELLEYRSCKKAAGLLRARDQGHAVFTRPPAPLPADPVYRRSHSASELREAYRAAAGKGRRRLPPGDAVFSPLVARPMVSVNSRIVNLLRRLYRQSVLKLKTVFGEARSRGELVAVFLAVLELISARRIRLTERDTEILFLGRMKESGTGAG